MGRLKINRFFGGKGPFQFRNFHSLYIRTNNTDRISIAIKQEVKALRTRLHSIAETVKVKAEPGFHFSLPVANNSTRVSCKLHFVAKFLPTEAEHLVSAEILEFFSLGMFAFIPAAAIRN